MKRLLLALFLCSLSQSSFASTLAREKFFCALPRALEYKDQILAMSGTDKTRHCAISCIIALDCSAFETYLFGLSKEVYDSFGGGTADAMDIEANKKGIQLVTDKTATTENECMDLCSDLYPKK